MIQNFIFFLNLARYLERERTKGLLNRKINSLSMSWVGHINGNAFFKVLQVLIHCFIRIWFASCRVITTAKTCSTNQACKHIA